MCGQIGIIFGERDRSEDELSEIKKIFTMMLIQCEIRGRFATGIALLKTNQKYHLFKKPEAASLFVHESKYQSILAKLDNSSTLLMGHTRFPTVGSILENGNNHPIRAGKVIGTHNGTITNADLLFNQFALRRTAKVDSEILFRVANSQIRKGVISASKFKQSLAAFEGHMSACLASLSDPATIVLIKGNKPLHAVYYAKQKLVLYASDARFIANAFEDNADIIDLKIKPFRMVVFKRDTIPNFGLKKFSLSKNNLVCSKGLQYV